MIKIRLRYIDEEEKQIALDNIKEKFEILTISKIYKDRDTSNHKRIYIEVENK